MKERKHTSLPDLKNPQRTKEILHQLISIRYCELLPYDKQVDFVFNKPLSKDEMINRVKDSRIVYANEWHSFLFSDHVLITNDSLLDNDNITFNQAVFVLLGFYANALDEALPNGVFFQDTFKTKTPNKLDECLAETIEFQRLQNYFTGSQYKPIQEFLDWAVSKGFLISNDAGQDNKAKSDKPLKTSSKEYKQSIITPIAERTVEDKPNYYTKTALATVLCEEKEVKALNITSNTIEKDYLTGYTKINGFNKPK